MAMKVAHGVYQIEYRKGNFTRRVTLMAHKMIVDWSEFLK